LVKKLSKFYFRLWASWATYITIRSFFLAAVMSFLVSSVLYVKQGYPSLNSEVIDALLSLFKFWFVILWNVAILLALFRSTKYLFNRCFAGYKLNLLTCVKEQNAEIIDPVGYGDLVKFWRRWFMLLIWLVASEMIFSLVLSFFFSSSESLFEWFNIYILFGFILLAGYFSFMLVSNRCKQVRIVKC